MKNIQKSVFSVVLIPDWKFLSRYLPGNAQKRKNIIRFRNFPEAFANVCLFLLRYRFAKKNSLLQQKQTPTKVIPVCFARKQFKWRHFIKVAGFLSIFYKPLKGTRHTQFPEERLQWKEFTVQFTIYNYTENWLHQKYFAWVFRFFKIARRASLEESFFYKVIGEISTLYRSGKNSLSLALVCFKKKFFWKFQEMYSLQH